MVSSEWVVIGSIGFVLLVVLVAWVYVKLKIASEKEESEERFQGRF